MIDPDYYRDRICIVTGANSGIGYAITEELLKRGAVVYMAGRNPDKIAKAAEDFSSYKDAVRRLVMDVSREEEVRKGIGHVAAEAKRIDLLFNNAGVGGTIPFEKATIDDWKKIIDTNIWSVIYGVSAAVPLMLEQGSGHIVNTSSIAGIVPPPFQALYSLTKYGVTGLTECLKYEYAEKGLRFSTICPANIATPIFNKGIDGEARGELRIPDDAYPADKAASLILDRVSENRGIIVVPEEPYTDMWKGYVLGEKAVEDELYRMARQRREAFEKGGSYF
ncbi:MAG TPA: SDR family oxidoreductase [Methanoregulaceae archaeon]|jgi:NAD(P)-dependent dehydrogenase (short-subunit alcohol dehydrogenase family)|nr:SDR family oxidoreductase [Methanolinea sp.]MDD3090388.1 SDR family NAD(P)-dependent oxidoreductase [Methanoregulaceae archaeon]MDD5047803.1 SDR family NAD(P)-dependent oxidoreductase [Methanoregulaceae archaeon]MDD5686107.1 SDR family NAD(P)-dependent oxidoreductase [Methanoregulaceae archaeon]HOP66731.1 SDR family oxidoreductase [Methanoregulaceae archaeon]